MAHFLFDIRDVRFVSGNNHFCSNNTIYTFPYSVCKQNKSKLEIAKMALKLETIDVVIIGASLSGPQAARSLQDAGFSTVALEA